MKFQLQSVADGVVFFRFLQLGYTDAVMNHRRAFLQTVAGVGAAAAAQASPQGPESDRQYWVRTWEISGTSVD